MDPSLTAMKGACLESVRTGNARGMLIRGIPFKEHVFDDATSIMNSEGFEADRNANDLINHIVECQ